MGAWPPAGPGRLTSSDPCAATKGAGGGAVALPFVAPGGHHRRTSPREASVSILRVSIASLSALVTVADLAAAQSDSRLPVTGRSMVITKYGIVAASQPLAARAGVQILERGGNAVDAAVATNAVMGLVEPQSNGIGGDLFAIVYEARTGTLHGLNASGWAPSGVTPALLKSKG